MYPTFSGPERRRQINLGGSSTTYSQQAILDSVKAQREQRLDHRRRVESAHKIQAWWRGTSEARRVKARLKAEFDAGNAIGLVEWTRLLVVGWSGGSADSARLARWSRTVLEGGNNALYHPFTTAQKESWLVLVQHTALLLLKELASDPMSPNAISHLQVLKLLFSPTYAACSKVASFSLQKGYFYFLASSLSMVPLEDKSAQPLPHLATLITAPFSIFGPSSSQYATSVTDLLSQVLTLPLFPNRFPLAVIPKLSARIPFNSLTLFSPMELLNRIPAPQSRAHLLANLATFVPIRWTKLSPDALSAFLGICAAIFDSIPIQLLEARAKDTSAPQISYDDSDDSDAETFGPRPGQAAAPTAGSLQRLDSTTLHRIQGLLSPDKVAALIGLTSKPSSLRPALFGFFLAATVAWPSKRNKLLSTIVFSSNGPILIKEIWREWIRGSFIGKLEQRTGISHLRDPSTKSTWPPLLFLVDLYSHALLTMGDDEFFGRGGPRVPRNPLTLDELSAFSKQLLNIVFTLYWSEDQLNFKEESVPGLAGTKWESARERMTKCLKAIHARDSRRKFTPEDHWLMTNSIDMQSFCEAAIFEEQKLDRTAPGRHPSKRQISYLSPRLGVLNNIPFAIPFPVRVEIFRSFVANDYARIESETNSNDPLGYHCSIRREHVAKDGYDALNGLGEKLKKRIRITFIDQWGNEERGIDGGGVFKEFLTALSKEAFDTDRGLWLATKQQALYPNPHAYAREPHQLSWYRFIGRVLGKAMYEGILVDVTFATFFLAKWLGKQSYLDDLASLDPELYQGLTFLKYYEGNVDDLSLNFTVTNEELGATKTIELMKDGANEAVTRENRTNYIYLVSNYRLNTQIKLQSQAFFEGLSEIIDPKWLRMFNQQELQILIGGTEDPVDINDLRANTVYGGAYHDTHDTIVLFWRVLESLNQVQRNLFLRFVSSCARPPLLGFKELNPKFSIRDAGSDNSRLPTASTCVNLLKLPMYTNEHMLRRKLLQAINSNAGFDLS